MNILWNLWEGVWDLTSYDKAPFEGWWTALARSGDGQALNLNLNFEKSGCELYYNYGAGNEEPFTEFSGTYRVTRRSESELEVTRMDGDPLVPGTASGRTLIFEPIG